ncbi:MAG: hypothetical protein ACD_35C00309G0001 [uncultured bacterium]|nr:MAG: hypothetical protein ACD_35C00309G0001 [uncultured bacterium]
MGDERGDLRQNIDIDHFGLQGIDDFILTCGASRFAARVDKTHILGCHRTIESLLACRKTNVVFGGDRCREGDLDAANGVNHGSKLIHLNRDIEGRFNTKIFT